jgi:hypothetical protein
MKTRDKFSMWVAWHLPHRVVMWAAIRVAAYATTGKYGNTVVPELTAMDAVQRWDDRKRDKVCTCQVNGAPRKKVLQLPVPSSGTRL